MSILHLHRRGIFLLERARVYVADGRPVYSMADHEGENEEGLVRSWNIPSLNTSVLLLGQGCSITQPASRILAEDEVMVAFTGTAGTPLFMSSQEYRPGDRLQKWASVWHDPLWRLEASRIMQAARIGAILKAWPKYAAEGFVADPSEGCQIFAHEMAQAETITHLMSAEAQHVKKLYIQASRAAGVRWNGRQDRNEQQDQANQYLNQGNYLAYGLAAIVLWAYGIPFSMPVTHGATRKGGLVFDLADTIKDALVLPTAFQIAASPGMTATQFRSECVRRLHSPVLNKNGSLGFMFNVIDDVLATIPEQKNSRPRVIPE